MKLHAHVLTILTLALAVLVGAEELDSRKVSEQFALNTMKDVSCALYTREPNDTHTSVLLLVP